MSYEYLIYLDICKLLINYKNNDLKTLKPYTIKDFKTKKYVTKITQINYNGSFMSMCHLLKKSFDDLKFNKLEVKLINDINDNLGIIWNLTEEEIFNYIHKFLSRDDILIYYKVSMDELEND